MREPDSNHRRPPGQTTDAWVVVIEATAGRERPPYEFAMVRQLVHLLEDWRATGLFCADRYAVQLDVEARGCSEALRLAMAAHNQAIDDIGMDRPSFLRCEVLTPDTMRDDWRAEDATHDPSGGLSSVPTGVYLATRALLLATTELELREVLAHFVADAGGSVAVGSQGRQPGFASADLGLAPDEQVHASVEALSVGGMLIELWIPGLVDDARCALGRLRRLRRQHDHR